MTHAAEAGVSTGAGAGSMSKSTRSIPKLTSLHDLVIDYVTTQAYSGTASILSRQGSSRQSPPSINTGTGGKDADSMEMEMEVDEEDGINVERKKKVKDSDIRVSLESIERRRDIIDHIINGNIVAAIDGLNEYFPSVLAIPPSGERISYNGNDNGGAYASSSGGSGRYTNGHYHTPHGNGHAGNGNGHGYSRQPTSTPFLLSEYSIPVFHKTYSPAHIHLNLMIQKFIESFRSTNSSSSSSSTPSSPSSSIGSLSNSNSNSMNGSQTLQHNLSAAQDLHKEAKTFPPDERAIYLQEIKDACALFAYTDPETSVLKGFLDNGRRLALADQVNSAILQSQDQPIQSQLESFARRTTAIYSILADQGIDPRPPWTTSGEAQGQGKEQLAAFWKHHTGKSFSLKELVTETW